VFEAFRERDYRAFWVTQFISNVGMWMQTVAQGWLVYRLTNSPFLLGFVGFASSAPAMLLMLPGGVVADQLDRKRVVAISQWAQAGCAMWLAIAIYVDRISVWQIIGAALIVGTAQSFSGPAWQAMVVDILEDRSRLPNAIAMNSLQFNISRALGPLLAGIAMTAWGPFWCFFLNAVSFLPLILVLGRIPTRQVMVERAGAIWAKLHEGFAYVRKDRVVLALLAVIASANVFGYPIIQLMPVVARRLFTDDRLGNAWLMGGAGIGSLAGALYLSIRTPKQKFAMIAGALFTLGVLLVGIGFAERAAPVVMMLAVCGASMVMAMALCNTSIQERIPDSMRGRVLSMYTFAFFAAVPFGNLLAGVLAERHGLGTTMVVLGAGVVATAIGAWVVLSRASRESPRSSNGGT
jgi:MFS family permease